MKIHPIGNHIYLGEKTIESIGTSGGVSLDTSSKKAINEWGTVKEIGPDVKTVKVGDTILFKAWGVDTITYEKVDHFFIAEDSNAICAVVTQ